MPSKKATEQAMLWLHNIAADKNSLDGVNAEICINVIRDLQRQNTRKGSIIHKLKQKLNEDGYFLTQSEMERLNFELDRAENTL